jgi:pyruvate ferredoxin oxidoreductase alpha subunit
MMEITEGSHAVSEAVRLCRPQVVSAYPITPQTHIVEALADMVANGQLDAEYITVENELSALSACVGASAAGSRTYSATTSQGLALMFEICFNAAGMRLPIVMSIANRAMGAPLSIWNDQQDSISLRDSGWLQFYAEDTQEATDLHFIAYRVAEDSSVSLPAFVCFDGFILSHTYEPVDMLSQEDADRYLPKFAPADRLDAADPVSFGMYATPEYYMEFRYEMDRAMKQSREAIRKAGAEFGKMFGRDYSALVEGYQLDDAETVIVAMGSICGTVKDTIDEMRAEGKKVGLLKIRVFRPFPAEEIAKALSKAKHIAVLDKNISIGAKGATALEVRDALYGKSSTPVSGFIIGLGGRDIRKSDIREIFALAQKSGNRDQYYGLRKEVL